LVSPQKQAPGKDGKKIWGSTKQKNLESEVIGTGKGEPADFALEVPTCIRPVTSKWMTD